jgi:GNAT superfamily N-acetyltransferase
VGQIPPVLMVSDHVVSPLGKEIVMRPFSATDAEVLVSWATSADELLQWAGPNFTYPLDRQQLVRYAASADHNHHLISAVARESGAVVGHAELNLLPQHELGRIQRVAVAPQWRSRGIGQKLLRWFSRSTRPRCAATGVSGSERRVSHGTPVRPARATGISYIWAYLTLGTVS